MESSRDGFSFEYVCSLFSTRFVVHASLMVCIWGALSIVVGQLPLGCTCNYRILQGFRGIPREFHEVQTGSRAKSRLHFANSYILPKHCGAPLTGPDWEPGREDGKTRSRSSHLFPVELKSSFLYPRQDRHGCTNLEP